MTDTSNLALPFIEASQAQKHVTHNEALRILDAVIQVAVRDATRTAPPSGPVDGQRHIVAASPTGAWAGHARAIATWQDGAWAFLTPKSGWCAWSIADDVMLVFDGVGWRAMGLPSLDSVSHLGINTSTDGSNLLSVRSNAALFAAINAADGGSGHMRLQISKESAASIASVIFADRYSSRAEVGLIGSDTFKLKVSPDGSAWVEALAVDQTSGNLVLPRGFALTGACVPAQITSNQNDYAPAGLAFASMLQISSDSGRSLSGLASGADGRVVGVVNVGGQPITLLDESGASVAANRFALGGNLVITGKQAAVLRYDASIARWQSLSGGLSLRADVAQSLTAAQKNQALVNLTTTTNNNASAGGIGEYIELSLSSASPVSLSNNSFQTPTAANAGISLSPGDWDVTGVTIFAASGQVMSAVICGISFSSNGIPIDDFAQSRIDYAAASPAGGFPALTTPIIRVTISTTTSVYLTCRASFGSGTVTAYGKIRARRVR